MKDVKLLNGDTVIDSCGRPVLIDGAQAKLQRALICLCARLGSFIYDRKLGSRLHTVSADEDLAQQKAELIAGEALAVFENTSVSASKEKDKIKITVTADGDSLSAEVNLNGNI